MGKESGSFLWVGWGKGGFPAGWGGGIQRIKREEEDRGKKKERGKKRKKKRN